MRTRLPVVGGVGVEVGGSLFELRAEEVGEELRGRTEAAEEEGGGPARQTPF